MLTESEAYGYLDAVKRHLKITWSDDDTDRTVLDAMMDAEIALNHQLGAEVDYFRPGAERSLFLNYMTYWYNDCLNEFKGAYASEILLLRHKYEVISEREVSKDDSV